MMPWRMKTLVFMVLVRFKMTGAVCGHTPSVLRCLFFLSIDCVDLDENIRQPANAVVEEKLVSFFGFGCIGFA